MQVSAERQRSERSITARLRRVAYQVLHVDALRHIYCRIRYLLLRHKMRVLETLSAGVGAQTVAHNMAALSQRAAFGMGNRMALLLYPTAVALRDSVDPRILIVGPRTEDDLYLAKALGLMNVRGLDLFSYSPMIDIGDIHATTYPSGSVDAVILGWVISYSAQPQDLIKECKRILAPGGYLAFGIESNPEYRRGQELKPPRVNTLNSAADIARLVDEPVAFIHDPQLEVPTDNAVVFQVRSTYRG